MSRIRVNDRAFQKMLDKLEDMPKDSMKKAYPFLKNKTPVRSGNARNKTKLNDNKIRSNYAYAGRLDEGWSKQAPSGFTEPTITELDNIIDKIIGNL